MNILFLTIAYSNTRNIYSDLMQEFKDRGDNVWVVCQNERRNGTSTSLKVEKGIKVLRLKTGNLTSIFRRPPR